MVGLDCRGIVGGTAQRLWLVSEGGRWRWERQRCMPSGQAAVWLAGQPANTHRSQLSNKQLHSLDGDMKIGFWYSTITICSCKATAQSAPQQAVERAPCVLCSSLRTRETKQIRSGRIRLLRLLPADAFNKVLFGLRDQSTVQPIQREQASTRLAWRFSVCTLLFSRCIALPFPLYFLFFLRSYCCLFFAFSLVLGSLSFPLHCSLASMHIPACGASLSHG